MTKSDHKQNALVIFNRRATVSDSLRLLMTKEQHWANRSCRSCQKSDVSDLLRSLRTKELHEWFAHDSSKSLAKTSNSLKKIIQTLCFSHKFLTVFTLFMPMRKSLPSLLTQSLFFKSNMSDSITSLFTKERPWAICSGCSWQKSAGSNLLFFSSASLFRSQKASESLEKPMSEFPTLLATGFGVQKRQTLVFG